MAYVTMQVEELLRKTLGLEDLLVRFDVVASDCYMNFSLKSLYKGILGV